MIKIIDNLASYGVYVIIDLHQDMMSSQFNAYDGVPLWVMRVHLFKINCINLLTYQR